MVTQCSQLFFYSEHAHILQFPLQSFEFFSSSFMAAISFSHFLFAVIVCDCAYNQDLC